MTTLSQIVGIEYSVKEGAKESLTAASELLKANPGSDGPYAGIIRVFEPLEGVDVGKLAQQKDLSDERQYVRLRTETILSQLSESLIRLFDVTLTREVGDTDAEADVVVTNHKTGNAQTLLKDVPVTYLLFLEKQLDRLRDLVFTQIPALDAAIDWQPDSNHVYRSPDFKTPSRAKQRFNWEKAPAVVRDGVGIPAQVEVLTDDLVVGHWATVKFSGCAHPDRIRTLLARLAELKRAVIQAREQANSTPVTDQRAGEAIFGWLLAD